MLYRGEYFMLETKDNTETKETKDNELKRESGSDYQVVSFFMEKMSQNLQISKLRWLSGRELMFFDGKNSQK